MCVDIVLPSTEIASLSDLMQLWSDDAIGHNSQQKLFRMRVCEKVFFWEFSESRLSSKDYCDYKANVQSGISRLSSKCQDWFLLLPNDSHSSQVYKTVSHLLLQCLGAVLALRPQSTESEWVEIRCGNPRVRILIHPFCNPSCHCSVHNFFNYTRILVASDRKDSGAGVSATCQMPLRIWTFNTSVTSNTKKIQLTMAGNSMHLKSLLYFYISYYAQPPYPSPRNRTF